MTFLRTWVPACLVAWLAGAMPAGAAPPPPATPPSYKPYADEARNILYNQMFGDDPALFDTLPGKEPTRQQLVLTAVPPDPRALKPIAEDARQDMRVRVLAWRRMQSGGHAVPARQLLGVVVEVARPAGLDALAAYRGGTARLLTPGPRIYTVENDPDVNLLVSRLMGAADPLAAALPAPAGPVRAAPPAAGQVRLTFLLADGVRIREGTFKALQQEAGAGPVLERSLALLRALVTQTAR
jgi:hypothetical protein